MPENNKFTLSDVLWLFGAWLVLIVIGAFSWALAIHLFEWFYILLKP